MIRHNPLERFAFKTIETEARVSARHLRDTGRPLFRDILEAERTDGRRVLFENTSAIAFIPSWVAWPSRPPSSSTSDRS